MFFLIKLKGTFFYMIKKLNRVSSFYGRKYKIDKIC